MLGDSSAPPGVLCAHAYSGVAGYTDLPLGSKLLLGRCYSKPWPFSHSLYHDLRLSVPQPLHTCCPGFVALVGRTEESMLPPFLWEPQNPALESKVSTLSQVPGAYLGSLPPVPSALTPKGRRQTQSFTKQEGSCSFQLVCVQKNGCGAAPRVQICHY